MSDCNRISCTVGILHVYYRVCWRRRVTLFEYKYNDRLLNPPVLQGQGIRTEVTELRVMSEFFLLIMLQYTMIIYTSRDKIPTTGSRQNNIWILWCSGDLRHPAFVALKGTTQSHLFSHFFLNISPL